MRLVTTSWIVPVAGPPIARGLVAVDGGTVAWVGRAGDPGQPEGVIEDLGPGVLLPGFVNAHTHLELTHLAGLDRAGGFVPWVERLVAARAGDGPDVSRDGARTAIRSLVEDTATVAVGDISNALGHLEELAASPLDAVVFHELLGWDPGRAEAIVASALARLAELPSTLPALGVRVVLAAHAPHSVSPALFARLRELGGPAFVHLAESPAEVSFLADGSGPWADFLRVRVGPVPFTPPGLSPVRYLDSLGVLGPGLVAAHCVQLPGDDAQCLAQHGVFAVLCPSSNRNLGVGVPDLPRLLAAGVPLALGTDSVASGDTLDVRDEAILLHELYPALPREPIVRALTQGGADALALPHLGSILPGRRAAFAFVPAVAAPSDPLAHVLSRDAVASRLVA